MGGRPLKQCKFLATGSWTEKTARACRCLSGTHKKLVCETVPADGAPRVKGLPSELKASAAYPWKLGKAIVAAWEGRPLGSEVGSGVLMHQTGSSSSSRCWAEPDSDNSGVQQPPSHSSGVLVCKKTATKHGKRQSPSATSDEEPWPARPSGSKRKWIMPSDSE